MCGVCQTEPAKDTDCGQDSVRDSSVFDFKQVGAASLDALHILAPFEREHVTPCMNSESTWRCSDIVHAAV